MPLYTYKCSECSETQTVDHPMMVDREVLCECGGSCKKVPGVGAVTFKGNGWGKDAR